MHVIDSIQTKLATVKKILNLVLSAAMLTSAACSYSHAQNFDRSKLTKLDHKFTIGFERRVYTLYPQDIHLSKNTTQAEENCNRLIFRMRLTTRFRMETGLSFAAIDRILANRIDKTVNIYQPCKLNIPLTIQYQFGSDKKRLRPYFGAGVQYTQQIISSNGETGISRDANDYYNRSLSNTVKYMNIIFTQGIIYDINPNLQVSQSLHIMPHASGFKPIGINIGVGYRIR